MKKLKSLVIILGILIALTSCKKAEAVSRGDEPDHEVIVKLPAKMVNSIIEKNDSSSNDSVENVSVDEDVETDMDRNIKTAAKYEIADKNLNKVYKKVMAILTENEKMALKREQRKWIKFRDSHCEDETTDFNSGSMYVAMLNSCLETKTDERIKELNEILKSKE